MRPNIYLMMLGVSLVGLLFASPANATFNINTGALNFTGNQLAEFYFDIDFGSTAHTEAWNITLTWNTNAGVEVEMSDCDRLATATNNTEWLAGWPFAGTTVPVTTAPGSGTITNWYTTPSYSGIHRFFITVAPADLAGIFPNSVSVALTNSAGAGTNSGGFLFHAWTTQNVSAIGTSGASSGFQRNYLQQTLGIATLGGASDQVQFQITATFPSVAASTNVSLRVITAAGTTGNVDFDFYDMGESGGQTPAFTLSAGPGASAANTHLTPPLANAQRFRVVMRAGAGFAPSTVVNFYITFGTNVQINDFLGSDPLPQQATTPVAITPASTTFTTSPAALTASGGSGSPSYNWSIQGTVPTGVSLSSATGASTSIIFGASTPSGSTVTVRAANGTTGEFDQETYTLNFGGTANTISVTASDPSAGEPSDNGAWTIAFSTATTASTDVIFSLSGTATLSTDYTLSPSVGGIAGNTLTVPSGTSSVVVSVVVVDNGTPESSETTIVTLSSATQGYTVGSPSQATVTVTDDDAGPALTITTLTLGAGTSGTLYAGGTINSTGGTGNHTWSLTSGILPAGLTLGTGPGASTAITGTPTQTGSFPITVQVVDSSGVPQTDTQAYTLVINAPGGGGGAGGGGGGGGGGCVADSNAPWMLAIGLLALFGFALRMRSRRV
jgi:large repetitive protein